MLTSCSLTYFFAKIEICSTCSSLRNILLMRKMVAVFISFLTFSLRLIFSIIFLANSAVLGKKASDNKSKVNFCCFLASY